MSEYEKLLYKLAKKAYSVGEVPVSAIIVRNNKVIAKAYNKRDKTNNPLSHAEIQCIIKASRKIKNWRLSDCDMYVTLKPCNMCSQVIKESRIKNVYYYVENTKVINYKTQFNKIDNSGSNLYKKLLTNFFENLR